MCQFEVFICKFFTIYRLSAGTIAPCKISALSRDQAHGRWTRTLTWIMNLGIMRWKLLPLYPNPFSPVHKARKFSAKGVTVKQIRTAYSLTNCPWDYIVEKLYQRIYKWSNKLCTPTSKTIRPMPFPSTAISKKHFTILEAGKKKVAISPSGLIGLAGARRYSI